MRSFLIALLSISYFIAIAQPPANFAAGGRVSGKIVDAAKNTPLAYSSVTLKSLKDSSLLLGSLVDEKGFFEVLHIPFGAYEITVSYIGYKDYTQKPIVVAPPDKIELNLGTIKVEEDTKVLEEVQITAEKNYMQINAEKKVFNMDKNVLSSGGSAIDALKQVSVVDVDQDGNLSMRGSGNLKVYINGKPSGITATNTKAILDAIPSSQIESIEVINNPSAKYDAEGDVGIINIVLKKNTKSGWNGNFTIGYGTKYDGNTGITLSYRKNKISFSTSYNFRFTESYYKGTGERYNFFPGKAPFYLNSTDRTAYYNFANTLSSNLDWDFKPKNTLSFSVLLSESNGKSKGVVHSIFLDSIMDYLNAYNRYTTANTLNWNAEANASYRRVFKDNNNDLVIAGNYAYSNRDNMPIYTQKPVAATYLEVNTVSLLQRNKFSNIAHTGFVQADFAQPFKKSKSKLELGYKYSIRNLLGDLYADSLWSATQQYVYDSSTSNKYKYYEQIHAAYLIFGGAVKKIFTYKAGMRVENTAINIHQYVGNLSYKQNYFNYFPSASFSFNLKKGHSLSVTYSKRINRPSAEQLNPFGNYSDPYNILTGNPRMKPAYTHAVELTHVKNIDLKPWKKDSTFHRSLFFSTTVYYRYAYNVFTRFNIVDSLGHSIVNFDNLNSGQNVGVEFTNRTNLFRWWNFVLSANLFYNQLKGSVPNGESDASTNSFQYNLRMMNTFNVTPKASIQFMVFYRSKIKFLQGEITPMVFANIGFKYDFLKNNKASIAVNVSDIFHTQYFGANTSGSNYRSSIKRYWESTIGNIVFTYRFGKSENKGQYSKQKKSNFEDAGNGVEGGGQ